jgi:hypothetical protein
MSSDRDCRQAREWIQDRLDAVLDDSSARTLSEHLASCEACSAYRDEIEGVHAALESLPPMRMPDEALQEVWSRTVDAGVREIPWWKVGFGWRPALAAAALLAVVATGWFVLDRRPPEQTDPELLQAASEARYVLEMTAAALKRSERAAVESVLAGQVSPALERIVIDWPEMPDRDERRNGV